MNIRQVMMTSAVVLAAFGALAAPANAATVLGVYNTGVDSAGNPLAIGAQDSHYVVDVTGYVTGGSPYVYDNGAYTVPHPDAGWISVNPDGSYPGPQGTSGHSIFYTETLTFSLAGYDASTAALSGYFASDNSASVSLNGHLLASLPFQGSFANFQGPAMAFSDLVSTDFLAGTNTLVFSVSDWGPPSALLVTDLSVTAGLVPEPATWAMFLLGFGGIGFMMRNSRRKAAAATA